MQRIRKLLQVNVEKYLSSYIYIYRKKYIYIPINNEKRWNNNTAELC